MYTESPPEQRASVEVGKAVGDLWASTGGKSYGSAIPAQLPVPKAIRSNLGLVALLVVEG